MTWTQFMDMHSGGGLKERDYSYIFIEAPKAEAKVIFYRRFGHNPERVSCTCCGDDYSINESPTLDDATAYEREGEKFLLIRADEIKPEERRGEVPEQGYVWRDR